MKRRDFFRNTALTALGTTLLPPLHARSESLTTFLESEQVSPRAALDNNFPLNFLAIGDWGRNGADHQLHVAKQMGQWATAHPNNFIISTGDNFYPSGIVSEHDPLWHYSFENIYTDFALQWDWYPILGNHDYKSDPDAQVRYSQISRRWKMPARYYSKEIALGNNGDKVLLLFIDTNPMIPEFYSNSEYGPHVAGQQPEKQLVWIEQTLQSASPAVKWKIVVGHHPMYTAGPRTTNYDTLGIRKVLENILEKHKVDVYLSGHDHSLQHLKTSGYTHHFISGAGSEVTPVKTGLPYSRFQAADYGFMYFSVNNTALQVQTVNHEGTVIYQTIITR
ncbi:Calcineurin-like phosphoesterase [Filimonas lacunae]|uniref:acid phosphatase n=1 Tax=Filimonas lacunae TaxID=477680 RepID=A0A173MK31_9BACT|nr:tartrate-resistant acid phosphatase type 5 family protein [Filimonas lacunae]BAV07829.1 purple acid phosphatase [Filimonas lacunae]SIT05322.1 Calcineurin-like phosphoesterase [Filimonas lacunae]